MSAEPHKRSEMQESKESLSAARQKKPPTKTVRGHPKNRILSIILDRVKVGLKKNAPLGASPQVGNIEIKSTFIKP